MLGKLTPAPVRTCLRSFLSRASIRWTAAVLAVFALSNALIFFAAPPWIRHEAARQLSGKLSRPVSIGHVFLNPYTLRVEIGEFRIAQKEAQGDLAVFENLKLNVSWESLWRGALIVEELWLKAPHFSVVRTAEQEFNFSDLIGQFAQPDVEDGTPLRFSLSNIQIEDASVDFDDRWRGERHTVRDARIYVPFIANTASQTDVFIEPLLEATIDDSPMSVAVQAKPFSESLASEIHVRIDRLSLPRYLTYSPIRLPIKLPSGTLSSELRIQFSKEESQPSVRLSGWLGIEHLSMRGADDQPLFEADAIRVSASSVEPLRNLFHISDVQIERPRLAASRDKEGRFSVERLIPVYTETAAAPKKDRLPPDLTIARLGLKDGALSFHDVQASGPVELKLNLLSLTVSDFSLVPGRPAQFALAGTVNEAGAVDISGEITVEPFRLAAQVHARELDVAAFEPYYGAQLNASIESAVLNLSGNILAEGEDHTLKLVYRGDAGLGAVRMLDKSTTDRFAGWESLNTAGIDVSYNALGTDVQIGQAALSDFYARVILDEKGRLNLSDFVAQEAAAPTSLTRTEPASPEPAATQPEEPEEAGPGFSMRLGEVLFHRGQVNFTDNFIKPNYTANLTDIDGRMGALSTRDDSATPVALQARLDARDPVAISGTIIPFAEKLSLDLSAKARDIVLKNFSPYATKYAGYPIVAGRLAVDVRYRLEDGELKADNHLTVDQLTFGERVESPTATRLPLQLAIALLKDSKGRIDLRLPVSGSLSDPQFSIGSVVRHAFINLIQKTVTAPFSFLAGMLGSSEQLAYIEFAPGSAVLTAEQAGKLNTLTRILEDRPALRLELIGRADPATDPPALPAVFVERQVKLQKAKVLAEQGQPTDPEHVTLSPDEYDEYLLRAYRDADFKKPRNFVGLKKSLPRVEMQKLLAANAPPVETPELEQLAQRRAAVVRQWFAGRLDEGRLETGAPNLDASEIEDGARTARVEFRLSN
jgi:uncharacterized protein involved in outer membrane biogenesis